VVEVTVVGTAAAVMEVDVPRFEVHECAFDDAATLERIGHLRYDVWEGEGSVAPALFPDRVWVDAMDKVDTARHWFVQNAAGEVVAAARLTVHEETDDYRDVELWKAKGTVYGVHCVIGICGRGMLFAATVTSVNNYSVNSSFCWLEAVISNQISNTCASKAL
jgi:hypothetical protein